METNQNRNWDIVEQQFEIFNKNFHILRDCTQLLYTQQQLNFNYDTVTALLLTLYADIKSYRAALYAYRLNLVNAVPSLLDKRLPISLVPRASLSVILESVHEAQMQHLDRLTKAIPMQDITSYYDAKLVREISTVPQGLLLTLAIPLSSSETAFDVYRAHFIPKPEKDPGVALQWKIEGPYLAISENTMESTVLSFEQFEECLGSARYKICHKTMETHLGQSSCLVTPYFHNAIAALQVCEPEQISLPTPEKATNLGYGI